MIQGHLFGRLLASVYDTALEDALWPATSRLIDEACGATGSSVIVGEGVGDDANVPFAAFYRRGERRRDMERLYFEYYHFRDERLPRLRNLRYGKLVRVVDLYSARELKKSATWNEALPRAGTQRGLNVRMRGPRGSRIVWAISDPVTGDWKTGSIRMIRRLMPHIRNFISVRQALAHASALGSSLVNLLGNARLGVIHLDRHGFIVEVNDRARHLLGQDSGLRQQDGLLRAWLPEDDARLSRLVAAALPATGAEAKGGSMWVRRPFTEPALTLHIHPVTVRQMDFGASNLGALVLIEDLDKPTRIDAGLVGSLLGLSPTESWVAVQLAEGRTAPGIAALSGRAESSIRTHVKRIHRKLGVSRRAELVRLVLSVQERAGFRRGS